MVRPPTHGASAYPRSRSRKILTDSISRSSYDKGLRRMTNFEAALVPEPAVIADRLWGKGSPPRTRRGWAS